jgi:hypothetical protein
MAKKVLTKKKRRSADTKKLDSIKRRRNKFKTKKALA